MCTSNVQVAKWILHNQNKHVCVELRARSQSLVYGQTMHAWGRSKMMWHHHTMLNLINLIHTSRFGINIADLAGIVTHKWVQMYEIYFILRFCLPGSGATQRQHSAAQSSTS